MPTYEFMNEKTGEVEDHFMSYTKLDEFKKDNPHLKQQLSSPNISYKGGESTLKKAGDGWKEVQDRIKSGLPPRLKGNIKTK